MKTLLLPLVLPCLVSALPGSHVQVSIGGSTYSHGKKVAMPEGVYQPAPAPAPMHPMPSPAPSYHVTPHPPAAPAYHHPAVTPVYHSKMSYKPIVHHAPAPAYHHVPVVHHAPAYVPKPAYHHHAPAYHPKHNCSLVTEMEKVEVCTPAFETKCMKVDLMVKRIVEKEQCQVISRTVCTESMETIPNEICTYSYMAHTEDTVAKTVEISFEKECMTQMVTVCQPKAGYGYHSYGHQYCKEVSQETCYNKPMVMPMDVPVMVTYPEPMKTCMDKPIMLPRVSCEDIMEEKCIMVPETMDDIEMVEKCETMLSAPSCQMLELSLPKQVCTELVYGHSYEADKMEYHHAKV